MSWDKLFLLLFALSGAVHLFFSWKDDRKARARTKPFPLFFLLLFYLTGASRPSMLLALAFFTSWMGDILLIPSGKRWFLSGGISFLLSHLFFILVFVRNIRWSVVPWFAVVPAALLYLALAWKLTNVLRNDVPGRMRYAMLAYMLMNSAMNIFALMQVFSLRSSGAIIACMGAVLFYASDCTLFLVRFYRRRSVVFKRHFTVMLTYLMAECFIAIGMMMI